MRTLLLVRHGHAQSNVEDVVSSRPPGKGLSELGVEEAMRLRERLAGVHVDLGVATRLVRTQETLAIGLGERDVPEYIGLVTR